MIELLFLIRFVRRLSRIAREKGRSGAWGGLGAACWFVGEILGFVLGAVATGDLGGEAYVIALLLAAAGATAAYFIVKGLKPLAGMELETLAVDGYVPPPQPVDLTNPYAPPRTR